MKNVLYRMPDKLHLDSLTVTGKTLGENIAGAGVYNDDVIRTLDNPVYAEGAPSLDVALLTAGVPVFGMCYGFQAMVQALGGTVAHTGLGEYGSTQATVLDLSSTLFDGQVAGSGSRIADRGICAGTEILRADAHRRHRHWFTLFG